MTRIFIFRPVPKITHKTRSGRDDRRAIYIDADVLVLCCTFLCIIIIITTEITISIVLYVRTDITRHEKFYISLRSMCCSSRNHGKINSLKKKKCLLIASSSSRINAYVRPNYGGDRSEWCSKMILSAV